MEKGDWVVCVNELRGFTKNKKYQIDIEIDIDTTLLVRNDKGNKQLVTSYFLRDRVDNYEYPERIFGDMMERVYYFKSVSEIREERINQILE